MRDKVITYFTDKKEMGEGYEDTKYAPLNLNRFHLRLFFSMAGTHTVIFEATG
jgi:hypothetical protein